ncbi:MAG: hypothetical protein WCP31_08590 [Chloroflexales bacterium]
MVKCPPTVAGSGRQEHLNYTRRAAVGGGLRPPSPGRLQRPLRTPSATT